MRLKRLLLPRQRGVAFVFASGKALRVLIPFLLIIAFFGCVMLASKSVLFASLAVGQGLAYLVSGHFASLIGTLRYLLGLERGRWQKINTN